jgi:hypothetical protein
MSAYKTVLKPDLSFSHLPSVEGLSNIPLHKTDERTLPCLIRVLVLSRYGLPTRPVQVLAKQMLTSVEGLSNMSLYKTDERTLPCPIPVLVLSRYGLPIRPVQVLAKQMITTFMTFTTQERS